MQFRDLCQSKLYFPVSFLVAGVSGVAVGYLVDRFCQEREKAQSEWDDIFDEPELEIPEGVNEYDTSKQEMENAVDKLFVKPSLKDYVDYTKFAKEYSDKNANEIPKEIIDDAPEFISVITEEEFVRDSGNLDGFVSVTGTYFTQDKVLAGWDDEIGEKDIEETIGWKAVRTFDDPSAKAVYVKNDLMKVLYEIVRCDDPYDDAVQESQMNQETDGF